MQIKHVFVTIIVLFSLLLPNLGQTQQQERPIVRLIYFLPSDRQPQPDINAKMDRLIKDTQLFYANQMETHGFGRKTFILETDKRGNAVVHHIKGQFNDVHYHNPSEVVWQEINEQFDTSKNIYLTALDISSESIGTGENGSDACGTGGYTGSTGGTALIPASGHCFNITNIAHELGHCFGLFHDFRSDTYLMSYGEYRDKLSRCAAEWLDVHRAFNSTSPVVVNEPTRIEMLPPGLKSLPNVISLRFKVTDPDGLYQAQLFTPTLYTAGSIGQPELLSCKWLNARNSTVEFVTNALTLETKEVSLWVMDVHGNFTWSQKFPVDIKPLLPSSEIVSMPDANLAAAVRQEIGNSITTHSLLNLTNLDIRNRGITDLTGLEHAHNLRELNLGGEVVETKELVNSGGYIEREILVNNNTVSDFSALIGLTQLTSLNFSSNNISDVSPLVSLTQLTSLNLSSNNISDVSPLVSLTQLTSLNLSSNNISDVSPLVSLTQLSKLYVQNNTISDISALTELTQLTFLDLSNNNISDVSSLVSLTQLSKLYVRSNAISDISALAELTQPTFLDLSSNNISDVSPLAGLTQLTHLYLAWNRISDISPLTGLTQLTHLYLAYNSISDVSTLAELTRMKFLDMTTNRISDISALISLTQLTGLYLTSNTISDVSPLVGLKLQGTHLDSGLYLMNNPLNYTSVHTHIPTMQGKGIKVLFDNTAHPALLKISGEAQEDAPGSVLMMPFVVEAMDAFGKPISGRSITFAITAGGGRLSTTTATTDTNGNAQTTLTLGPNPGVNKVRVTAAQITSPVTFTATATETAQLAADVNGDGMVNVLDLVAIVSSFNQTGPNSADVNGDGIVNLLDLVLVAGAFGDGAAAAPTLQSLELEGFTAAEIQDLLTQARQLALTDPIYLRGILMLEQLLIALTPKETALLSNYPNPFNPETWIPYQLAKPAAVTLHIYSINGELVRTLALGHQPAGMYQTRSRAAYWDGRNAVGETVASGIYFYTLTAGGFTATRKMLIRK